MKLLKLDIEGISHASPRIEEARHNTARSCTLTVTRKPNKHPPIDSRFCNLLPNFHSRFPYFPRLKVLPQIVPFSFAEPGESINVHESVSTLCSINKGDLPLNIWWTLTSSDLLTDRNLTSSEIVTITRNSQKLSVLNIESVQAQHRGNYTCYAQNRAGIAQHSSFLLIKGESTL